MNAEGPAGLRLPLQLLPRDLQPPRAHGGTHRGHAPRLPPAAPPGAVAGARPRARRGRARGRHRGAASSPATSRPMRRSSGAAWPSPPIPACSRSISRPAPRGTITTPGCNGSKAPAPPRACAPTSNSRPMSRAAPAAAITCSSAARRPSKTRSSRTRAGSSRSCATGSGIPRSPTFSPGRTSAPPRKRRARMNPPARCTIWKWRTSSSRSCRPARITARSSARRCAICIPTPPAIPTAARSPSISFGTAPSTAAAAGSSNFAPSRACRTPSGCPPSRSSGAPSPPCCSTRPKQPALDRFRRASCTISTSSPRSLWADFRTILADLRRAGLALPEEIFRTIYEWRFPRMLEFRDGAAHAGNPQGARAVAAALRDPAGRRQYQPLRRYLHRAGRSQRLAALSPSATGSSCKAASSSSTARKTAPPRIGLRYRRTALYPSLHPGIKPHMPLARDRHQSRRQSRGRPSSSTTAPGASSPAEPTAPPAKAPPCRRLKPELVTCDLRIG